MIDYLVLSLAMETLCKICSGPHATGECLEDNGNADPNTDRSSDDNFDVDNATITESLRELFRQNKEQIRQVLKHMVIWGLVSASSLIALERSLPVPGEPEGDKKEDVQKPPPGLEDDPFFKQHFGDFLPGSIERAIQQQEVNREQGEGVQKKEVTVVDFEKLDVDSEKLKQILLETYPDNWVDTEIDSVIFLPEVSDDADTTQQSSRDGWSRVGLARTDAGETSVDLNEQYSLSAVHETFAHETGHANDWENDNTLSADDKRALFKKVAERYLTGENTFHSEYVESRENEDPHFEQWIKVMEYWAEICEAYFVAPDDLQNNHPDDFTLVDNWVKKQDPTYDPFSMAQERIEKIVDLEDDASKKARERIEAENQEKYDSLPDEAKQEIESLVNTISLEINESFFSHHGYGSTQFEAFHDQIDEICAKHSVDDVDWLTQRVYDTSMEQAYDNQENFNDTSRADIINQLSPESLGELQDIKNQYVNEVNNSELIDDDWDKIWGKLVSSVHEFVERNNLPHPPDIYTDWVFLN